MRLLKVANRNYPVARKWDGRWTSASRRLLRVGHGFKETKEAFHTCNLERLVDPLVHAHQPQAASIFLSSDIGADQRPNPRRIRQGYAREVQNESARVVGPHLGLKAK